MRKKVNKRKKRIIDHLERAVAAIEWDMWEHKGWQALRYGRGSEHEIPKNEAHRELQVAIEKIKEAAARVKKHHGLTHLFEDPGD
jgi:hypothetical protein